jgi:hypothetical protein
MTRREPTSTPSAPVPQNHGMDERNLALAAMWATSTEPDLCDALSDLLRAVEAVDRGDRQAALEAISDAGRGLLASVAVLAQAKAAVVQGYGGHIYH